ncbi:hypothetical protein [Pseudosporangium ferrugineum]|uniref:Uncharacterized protein n=1 Tax=Pseudosporangium ferrugineum TaxID=439699 RepID=A0A2T0RSF0_9ACTN|nr:hypothetical protein [Pseudosporangium ferrugineum]PRY24062.1 hypothetical protein CLV70_114195 [Pseudosporangium ferrugineum]
MPFDSEAEVSFRLLDMADDYVTRDGTDIPAWFDIQLSRDDWPTEIVLSVMVDTDQGPIINGIRGGRGYRNGYQEVAKLFRDSTDAAFMLRFVTAQAAGALATDRLLRPHLDEIDLDEGTAKKIVKMRDHFARRSFGATEVQRRRRVTRELLEQVAQVYRAAFRDGQPPTQAVAETFHVSHSTAGRWVVEARKAGALGPATGTRPGEATSD